MSAPIYDAIKNNPGILPGIQLAKLSVDQAIAITGLVQRGKLSDAILDIMNYASCSYEMAYHRVQCIAAELDKQ